MTEGCRLASPSWSVMMRDCTIVDKPMGRCRGVRQLSEPEYQTVAHVGELIEGRGIEVKLDGRSIALFLDEGAYYAIDNACPHQGAPLCDGVVHDKSVTCLWHGWRFSLEDGRWLDSPRTRIGSYRVRVVGNDIQVGYPLV